MAKHQEAVVRTLITRWDHAVENGNPWALAGLLVLCAGGFVTVVLYEFFHELLRPNASGAEGLQYALVRHDGPQRRSRPSRVDARPSTMDGVTS